MNPLLVTSDLPQFSKIQPAHITPAIDSLIAEFRALIAQLAQLPTPPRWETFVRPLEDASDRLERAWNQVSHLNAVVNSPALRDAYNSNLAKITQFAAEMGQHPALFQGYLALQQSPDFAQLSQARQQVINNAVRDFRLSGAELPPAQQQRFREIAERLAQLSSQFADNVLDATNDFALYIEDPAQLDGVPEDVLHGLQEAASKDGQNGWKLSLQMPCYLPVMQYCTQRALREQLYRAAGARASEFGKPEWDNSALIKEILQLRQEKAQLLGYASYAELSLATKMADKPEQVLDFLHELARRAKPFAERDMQELREFAQAELGLTELAPWDVPFVSERLRQARYAFSEQELKRYFPEQVVLDGLFYLVEHLYELQIKPAATETWHEDAHFYDIRNRDGSLVGQFYLDLYARDKKRGGAWMADAVCRRGMVNGVQTPVAFLTCNFSRPVGNLPALFTHDEVITLFHEFGHGLHHLLTQVDELMVSGINGVEWDAVELPSQFMENFCWEWELLQRMTRHIDSGATLPKDLYDKMLAGKNFQSGMQMVRQLEFALFDMLLHHKFDPAKDDYMAMLARVRQEVAVIFPPAEHRFPNQFSHIFAGGYAAGYYSYKWAEVLSADAYSLLEEEGVLTGNAGRRFREEVLAVGGSRPAMESFKAFRGREPQLEALLRHSGLAA